MYTLGIPDRQKRRTLGYLKQNFKFVETNLDLSKKTWYANIWCYNE